MRISISAVILAVLLRAPVAFGLPVFPEPPSGAAAQEKQEVVVTVESVSAEEKTIKVQEMKDPIVISDSTVFDDDVQLAKLHAGSKIKVVGATTADGKFQASEIRVAK